MGESRKVKSICTKHMKYPMRWNPWFMRVATAQPKASKQANRDTTSNFNKMRYLVNNTTKHNTYCSFSTRHLSSNENGLWYLSALLSILSTIKWRCWWWWYSRMHTQYRHRHRSCHYPIQSNPKGIQKCEHVYANESAGTSFKRDVHF